ncbi:histidine kinase [Pedobacter caeni]|uniref:Histidine kinase n=1 Tax=Pedobacter caeni TaxID=288992 RepID=A0A1M4V105_9SPHI|nr:histidine kinase [Pedobacter caeni]SHE62582.1 Histidine kinase [Pedobacter caeni]
MSNFVQLEINERNRWVYFSKYRWVAHIVYWITVLIVGTIMRAKGPITPSLIYNHFFLANLMIASFFYLYCLYLIPYFFKRNKYLQFWTSVIAGYLIITFLDIHFNRAFVHYTDPVPPPDEGNFLTTYLKELSGFLYNFLFFSIMLFFMEKNEENSTLLELEKEKKEIEQVKLDFLKTNISPDFILRSLHQLKVSAKVPEESTPEAILTFSDLLRYRLYRGRQSQSPLKEELSAFTSFVHFIGFDHQLKITFNVQGVAEHKQLAPLALVNLLEPFCKILNEEPVMLDIIILIETEELLMEMNYGANAGLELIADLESYRENYRQINGDAVKFHFEQSEENSFKVRLSLPIFNH